MSVLKMSPSTAARILFTFTISLTSMRASAVGVCDILTGFQISQGGFLGLGFSTSLPGGRTTKGSSFAAAFQDEGDDSSPSGIVNGKLNESITLKDDLGKAHTLSGKLRVSQLYMVQAPPSATYVCLSLNGVDNAIPFRIANGADIIDTPVRASTSGRSYGLQILSQGGEHQYIATPNSCNYSGPTQQICNTYEDGSTHCHDQTVTTTTSCTQGETETDTQGTEYNFGITDKSGKVIGTFVLVK